ncbi:murein biosynthesis integral membrane protein MurJ, partial [Thermodesulfobacteriota bacterium]
IAPGVTDPEAKAAAVRMTRIILPAQFFFFSGGLFMAVQFAKERFALPALAPLLYNVGIILGGIVLGPRLGMEGFSWGVLAGAFAGNFVVQYVGARRVGMRLYPVFKVGHPDLRRYVLLTLPLMVGLTMTFSTEFFLRFFGSYLPGGNIAALNYGLRVMLIVVGLFGQAVGVASYPFLARLAVEGKVHEMNKLLNKTLRYLSLVIPVAVLLIVLRNEVVGILFERGRFDADATALTASVLPFLLAGSFAFAAQTVVVRGYYAMQNTIFPTVLGSLAVLLSIPIYVFGLRTMGVSGVALAISFSSVFQVVLLYALWNKRTKNTGGRGVFSLYARVIAMSLPLYILLEWFRFQVTGIIGLSSLAGRLAVCFITGVAFLGVLLMAGSALKVPEVSGLFAQLNKRRRQRT